MNFVFKPIADWAHSVVRGWNDFWFTPALPHTLALIRIFGGAMLLYTHLVWSINLTAFLGPKSWLTADTVSLLGQDLDGKNYTWSYLYWIESPALLWTLHIAALIVFVLLTLGLFTRVTAILAWIITISYCHRLNGTLFGIAKMNAFIAHSLMIGDSGGASSLDRWLASRRIQTSPLNTHYSPDVSTNIAIRLLQIHMCVIYLFGGIAKMRGETWWDGSALWYAFASLEYQSLDMTWLARHLWLLALMTHLTVFWETFYCFLVWPRLTRPLCLAMAVAVHLGIALCLGMKTFGLAMIIGNLAFVYPETVRDFVTRLSRRVTIPKASTLAPPSQRESLAVAATR